MFGWFMTFMILTSLEILSDLVLSRDLSIILTETSILVVVSRASITRTKFPLPMIFTKLYWFICFSRWGHDDKRLSKTGIEFIISILNYFFKYFVHWKVKQRVYWKSLIENKERRKKSKNPFCEKQTLNLMASFLDNNLKMTNRLGFIIHRPCILMGIFLWQI